MGGGLRLSWYLTSPSHTLPLLLPQRGPPLQTDLQLLDELALSGTCRDKGTGKHPGSEHPLSEDLSDGEGRETTQKLQRGEEQRKNHERTASHKT